MVIATIIKGVVFLHEERRKTEKKKKKKLKVTGKESGSGILMAKVAICYS